MRLAPCIPLLVTGLVSLCAADFDLYRLADITGGRITTGWQVFEAGIVPTCEQVGNATFFRSRDDVSSRIGVRCTGVCFLAEPGESIEVLEMNFRNDSIYHWSEFCVLPAPGLHRSCVEEYPWGVMWLPSEVVRG